MQLGSRLYLCALLIVIMIAVNVYHFDIYVLFVILYIYIYIVIVINFIVRYIIYYLLSFDFILFFALE